MLIQIRVHPSAKQSAVVKLLDGTYEIYTTAHPQGGHANKAIFRLLSDHFQLPISLFKIRRGAKLRHKLIDIDAESLHDSP